MRGRLASVALALATALSAPVHAQQQESPRVLGVDRPTTTSWQATRLMLPSHVVELRRMVREGGDSETLEQVLERLQESLDEYDMNARALAVEEYDQITDARRRAEFLMTNLAQDFDIGSDIELLTTLRLLETSVNELEELAAQSDRRHGRQGAQEGGVFPADWGPPRHGSAVTRSGVALMTAEDLAATISLRREQLWQSSRTGLNLQDDPLIREIGEMARALAMRQGEFPPLMRQGVRNAALRTEVIADNLIDYLRAGDRANYRRQLALMRDSLRTVEGYLKVRDELAAGAP